MTRQQKKALFVLWFGYANFYLLRLNYGIAIPGIMAEYGYSRGELGLGASFFFMLYAFGLLISGVLSDRLGPKRILVFGLLCSILVNLAFPSIASSLFCIVFLWSVNGFFQAMGWAPTVKMTSPWFEEGQKGRASAILGTSYIIGSALSWLLAGYLAQNYSWRLVFYGPTLIAAVILSLYLLCIEQPARAPVSASQSIFKILAVVVAEKKIWYVGFTLLGLNTVIYGFMTWAPIYYFEQGGDIQQATHKALLFPIAGALGSLFMGWLCDKFFPKRRLFVGFMAMVILLFSILLFPYTTLPFVSLSCLVLVGATAYGTEVLLVSQFPMIFGNQKNTATIVGVIDSIGYVGAVITSVTSGFLTDIWGWSAAFYFWIGGGVFAMVFLLICQRQLGHSLR